MYGMNYSGGANKTHGQIEWVDRIDSFEVQSGIVHARHDGAVLPLDCSRFILRERELVELSYLGGRWRNSLELERVRSGFGGSRTFWLCPCCGRRARYLYFARSKDEARSTGRFVCRNCAKLNYRCQQRTRDSLRHVEDGLKLAREKLGWKPPSWVTPLDFPDLTPPCPRYMHEATYRRHLARFRRYQEAYRREVMRKILTLRAMLGQR